VYQLVVLLENGGPLTPSKLAKLTGRSVATISIHLGKLRSADVVRYDSRGRQTRYWLKHKRETGELLKALEAVIHADRRVSLHEFAVLMLMRSQLGQQPAAAISKSKTIADARADIGLLLSLVAYAGRRPGPEADRESAAAFRAGATEMGLEDAAPVSRRATQLDAVGAALENLRALAPSAKAVLVKGLFAAVTADGTIRIIEAELMRMVGAVLDCPLPPLLDDLDPAAMAA